MSFLKLSLILLKKPKDVECEILYEVQSYKVCISSGKYIPFDALSEEPEAEIELANIAEKVHRMLIIEEKVYEDVIETIPEKYRNIVTRQIQGYGALEPLFLDDNVIDIHILYNEDRKPPICVQVMHREYGRLEAVVPLTFEEVRELILRLSSLAGKVVSEAKPVHSFIEPRYNSRVSVVYYSDVTLRRGMGIDIRKQPEKPWTILKLIDLKTLSIEEAAFLWLAMKYKLPVLVVGELMSGKTTMINAVINLIPPGTRVMTIEDTPEIKIYTPYWIRTTTREAEAYPINIFNLIKIAVRLSVDYIVIGEIRGEEAREWAQAILLGHGGISSFHASDPESALIRLKTPPIEVNPQALKELNIFVKMIPIISRTGRLERRSELYIYEDEKFHKLFIYDPETDTIYRNQEVNPLGFRFFNKAILSHGVTRKRLETEYKAMIRLLQDLYSQYKQVDPSLETPDYAELTTILYQKLDEYILRIEASDAT